MRPHFYILKIPERADDIQIYTLASLDCVTYMQVMVWMMNAIIWLKCIYLYVCIYIYKTPLHNFLCSKRCSSITNTHTKKTYNIITSCLMKIYKKNNIKMSVNIKINLTVKWCLLVTDKEWFSSVISFKNFGPWPWSTNSVLSRATVCKNYSPFSWFIRQ